MRYYYEPSGRTKPIYGKLYKCNHSHYNECTLYLNNGVGLAIVQEYFDETTKHWYYGPIDPEIANDIYLNIGFPTYFKEYAQKGTDGIYPTKTLRSVMWSLRMKPLPKKWWETKL